MYKNLLFLRSSVIMYFSLALSDGRLTKRSHQTYGFTFGEQTSSTEFRIILDHGQIPPFILRRLQNARVFSLTLFLAKIGGRAS